MRCDGLTARMVPAVVAVLLSGGLVGCHRGPQVLTAIEFDGATRNITTTDVVCTKQPDGGLVIMVQDTPRRTVRIQLTQQGRLVVQKAGLRDDDMAGFVADTGEVIATKVDDTFTFSGRMPPNAGESQWHTFKIQTTCPGYAGAPAPRMDVPIGAP
jgi:Mycobacterium 19 kDa lipoprotein antigen